MSASKFDLDPDFVRKLAKLLEETGLSEIEFAEGDRKIRCTMTPRGTVVHAAPVLPALAPLPLQTTSTQTEVPKSTATGTITSPMVGTVYLSSSPGATPFVKVGDTIKTGDTLLIIEAMKVMNPIKALKSGTITEILVADAQPVEFGEPLIVIS